MNGYRPAGTARVWRLPVVRLWVAPEPPEAAAGKPAPAAVTVVHYHLHVHGGDLPPAVAALPPGAAVTVEEEP